MAVTWSIVGEAGKTVDDSGHSLAELGASGAVVDFRSLAADTMSWQVPFVDATGATALLPDLGQKLTLNRDGERYFEGRVTGRRIIGDARSPRAQITVSGPWWWMSQVPLSSDTADQAGDASERPQFVFATGSPRTHLMALAARSTALGVPVSTGSIASVFPVPRLTLRDMPLSESAAEIMRWVADGVAYIDYTVEGAPAISMQRRPAAATVTITPGQETWPIIDVAPRIDLEVQEVVVQSATRETVANKRVTVWASETAGDASAAAVPSRQIALVTGPEIDTYLPQDFTDSVVVKSLPFAGNGGVLLKLIEPIFDATGAGTPSIGQFYEQLGAIHVNIPGIGYVGQAPGNPNQNQYAHSVRVVDTDGNALPAGYTHFLTLGEPRDWWAQAGIEYKEVVVSAVAFQRTINPDDPPSQPEWAELLGADSYATPYGGDYYRYDWKLVSGRAVAVKTSWAAETTLVRPEDYAFVHPPAGLAANLLATQNWLPYEGSISFVQEEIPAGHYLGSALNIAGWRPETANMRAMITGHSVALATGEVTLTIGAPDRLAYRDLVNRFRASGADNLVWLVESVSGDPGENPPPDPELEIPVAGEFELTFDGTGIVFSGEPIAYTPLPAGVIGFNGSPITYDAEILTYN
ncbi:hypothetical protein [Haloferula sargassicola]|uniref:Minor tail protein n=1 Tax=Haloferula sargassicola TaxID=490096 RepID=A0ABP9ULD1_9BACT